MVALDTSFTVISPALPVNGRARFIRSYLFVMNHLLWRGRYAPPPYQSGDRLQPARLMEACQAPRALRRYSGSGSDEALPRPVRRCRVYSRKDIATRGT